ncbi:MAG: pyruvate synthase subunit beta [Deltaproteobacteria bacterium]|nr:pyruvate synthase subunit beta [Deltaproteobacteria bacterium]
MEPFNVYAARLLPSQELFAQGHRACQGCGPALALRYLLKALGPETIVANATGCMEIISSSWPETAWGVPWIHVAFENAAAVASGVEAGSKALRRKGRIPDKKPTVVAIAGDGGTFDIGLQALSGALERGHDFIYLCYDNEAYMNTGIQRSSGTPFGAATTTSPAGSKSFGQKTWKKDLAAIGVAHHIPYVATASIAYPFDFVEKVKKAAAVEGPALIHVFAPCPTGWRTPSNLTVRLARLAVQTGMFPLYEVENGKYHMSVDLPFLKPLDDYLKPQGRYRHLTKDVIAVLKKGIDQRYNEILEKCEANHE